MRREKVIVYINYKAWVSNLKCISSYKHNYKLRNFAYFYNTSSVTLQNEYSTDNTRPRIHTQQLFYQH